MERLISLSLSLTENQFILYQFLVECLYLKGFENLNSRDLLTVPDLKSIKKNDIVVRMTYVHFSLPTTFSSKFEFFV